MFQNDQLELIINTIVVLFPAQKNLLEYLPSLGHIPRVVSQLTSTNPAVQRATVLATHQFTSSKVSNNSILFSNSSFNL